MFRAYDTLTEWQGKVRKTAEQASKDAQEHNAGCKKQGGFGSAIVVRPDPECPDRCVDMQGVEVWPPHGRSTGTVRWR